MSFLQAVSMLVSSLVPTAPALQGEPGNKATSLLREMEKGKTVTINFNFNVGPPDQH